MTSDLIASFGNPEIDLRPETFVIQQPILEFGDGGRGELYAALDGGVDIYGRPMSELIFKLFPASLDYYRARFDQDKEGFINKRYPSVYIYPINHINPAFRVVKVLCDYYGGEDTPELNLIHHTVRLLAKEQIRSANLRREMAVVMQDYSEILSNAQRRILEQVEFLKEIRGHATPTPKEDKTEESISQKDFGEMAE